MSNLFDEEWIGKNINFDKIWDDYNTRGQIYIDKFMKSKPSMHKIVFDLPKEKPIFNQMVIYKSFKGLFHNLKKSFLSDEEYRNSNPIYLYSIERGSAEWSFLLDHTMIDLYFHIIIFGVDLYLNKRETRKLENHIDAKLKSFIEDKKHQSVFSNLANQNINRLIMRKDINGNEETIIEFDNQNQQEYRHDDE